MIANLRILSGKKTDGLPSAGGSPLHHFTRTT